MKNQESGWKEAPYEIGFATTPDNFDRMAKWACELTKPPVKQSLIARTLEAKYRFKVHRMRDPHALHLGKAEQEELERLKADLLALEQMIEDPSCTEERLCGLKIIRESCASELRIT